MACTAQVYKAGLWSQFSTTMRRFLPYYGGGPSFLNLLSTFLLCLPIPETHAQRGFDDHANRMSIEQLASGSPTSLAATPTGTANDGAPSSLVLLPTGVWSNFSSTVLSTSPASSESSATVTDPGSSPLGARGTEVPVKRDAIPTCLKSAEASCYNLAANCIDSVRFEVG